METNTFETGLRPLTAELVAVLKAEAASDQARLDLPGWRYRGLAAFVLVEGKPFYPGDLDAGQRRLARSVGAAHWRVHGPFQHGEPFLNAQRCLLLDNARTVTYVEGFVFDERAGYPELHAWLSVGGKVVDFTAAASGREVPRGSEPPEVFGLSPRRTYLGVEIRREYVEQRARETGRLASLVDDWEHGFPLLRGRDAEWREAHSLNIE